MAYIEGTEEKRHVFDLERTAQLVLEKDNEAIFVFRDKLWVLSVEIEDDWRSLVMSSFPDKEDFDEYITGLIIDDGYSVTGGSSRDEMIIDFND